MFKDLSNETFRIYSDFLPLFEDKLHKINKKAIKNGLDPIQTEVVSEETVHHKNGEVDLFSNIKLHGAVPKIEGWTFRAKIDHGVDQSGQGNFIYSVPGYTLDQKYWNATPVCDHCNINRFRKQTFIIENDNTGEIRQIGRSCIREYIGLDPTPIIRFFEFMTQLCHTAEELVSQKSDREYVGPHDYRRIDIAEYLAHVSRTIRVDGWLGRSEAIRQDRAGDSSADLALTTFFHCMNGRAENWEQPSEKDYEVSKKTIEYINTLDPSVSSLQFNMTQIVKVSYIDVKATGIGAWLVQAYYKHIENEIKEANKAKISNHIGTIGERYETTVTIVRSIYLGDRQFPCQMITMMDEEGNIFLTYSSGKFNPEVGSIVSIKGSISAHSEFKGVKQTQLKRVTELSK